MGGVQLNLTKNIRERALSLRGVVRRRRVDPHKDGKSPSYVSQRGKWEVWCEVPYRSILGVQEEFQNLRIFCGSKKNTRD